MKNLYYADTRVLDGFWNHYGKLVRDVTIWSVYDRFAETGRFDALACNWKEGQPNQPHIFWDSDVAKWIEAAAYLTGVRKEPRLEAIVDAAVENIEKNQLPCGYFNSYFIAMEPENIFRIRDNHELYCAGHLLEAAIAYDRATGKSRFLKTMIRYADYIYQVFMVEKSAGFVTPGHEEVELALLKLAEYTGRKKYRDLAMYFLKERGRHPEENGGLHLPRVTQSDHPVLEIKEAAGHAVRACYLYTAMADMARQTGDPELLEVCRGIFRDIAETKLSITGGIGASMLGEAFGQPYVLPNRTNYNETCAAIALAMFCGELLQIRAESAYADVIERILFNGMLSGISLAGDSFFYENALEIDRRDYDYSLQGVTEMEPVIAHSRGVVHRRRLQRAKVFHCSCCPPNLARMLASLARYMYSVDEETIYCHQFAHARTELTVAGKPAVLEQATDYPVSGKLSFTYHGAPARLAVRIPDWCVEYTGEKVNGYAVFPVTDGQIVGLELPMAVHFVEANPKVRDNAGRFAVTRGPLVYCMEAVDNGENLWDVELLEKGRTKVHLSEEYHAPVISMEARRRPECSSLYQLKSDARINFTAKLIPYFAFANRGESDMLIWALVR